MTCSLELFQQANARLHRQGQQRPVIVHRLLVQGGVDEDVAKALEGKDETQAALVEALKARIRGIRGFGKAETDFDDSEGSAKSPSARIERWSGNE